FAPDDQGGAPRLAVARLDENNVSRTHVVIEPAGEHQVRVTNKSGTQPVGLGDGTQLPAKGTRELPVPLVLTLGKKTVRIQGPDPEDTGGSGEMLSLDVSLPPGALMTRRELKALPAAGDVSIESVVEWFQATLSVLQSAASSSDFFERAARAVVDLVGLDCGMVMILEQGDWTRKALERAPRLLREPEPQPSKQILTRVQHEKRTFWQVPQTNDPKASLAEIQALVAAPILASDGNVIGILYGDRSRETAYTKPVSRVDAMLVELLASGVAAGLARLAQEEAALSARVLFEQFFTPELSYQLSVNPDLLKVRDACITVMFCDIRQFSRISDTLGPSNTVQWLNDVMTELSECVSDNGGVLVNYIGDELMCMWGAPVEQEDQAARACRAALDMVGLLDKLNERWQPTLKQTFDFGVGINTGMASVGNTGSQRKFIYGPLGSTVNLASRVQGANKYFKTRILITSKSRERLEPDVPSRRLGQVRVVNMGEPVELYELFPPDKPNWPEIRKKYEQALGEFEKNNHRAAASILANLVTEHPDDGPALVLLSRTVSALVEEKTDHVWDLPGK
ncbi:MAG: adenylate/guanylate cyclase domain-containing protein, partial [Gemmataceae bacterium]